MTLDDTSLLAYLLSKFPFKKKRLKSKQKYITVPLVACFVALETVCTVRPFICSIL